MPCRHGGKRRQETNEDMPELHRDSIGPAAFDWLVRMCPPQQQADAGMDLHQPLLHGQAARPQRENRLLPPLRSAARDQFTVTRCPIICPATCPTWAPWGLNMSAVKGPAKLLP